jgi:hypothetical protein
MTRSLSAAVFLCLALNGFALDPANYASSLVSTSTEGESTVVTLQDASGRSFVVAYLEEPSADVMKKVVQLKDLFFAWKNIAIRSLRFTITDDIVDSLVIPDRILVNGSDVQSFVPAGLLFSFSGSLGYDFRVTKDNFFLRVRGTYSSEEEMTQKIAAALANPATFLQRSDMEYVLSRVEALAARVEALGARVEALAAEVDARAAEVDTLRYAAMRRENTEWLFWKVPIPRDGLKRVVELKRQNPALTKSEVEAQLKQEGIKISGGAIGIIFEYYFNEF